MHDVVRDVAISIASRVQHVFAVKNVVVPPTSWPDKDALKVCTAISLKNSNISELPQVFECPQLKYFHIANDPSRRIPVHIANDPSRRIPDKFFTGMRELRVLDFARMHLLPLPSSLRLFQNLQTLSLDYCELGDIAIVGDLKTLVILTLRGSDMEKLVEEIGQLTHLRLLDLSNCFNLKVIPPNVISSLSQLEELYIGESPIMWGKVGGVDGEGRNASLDELNNLSKLTSLEILIEDEKTLPRDLSFFKMLQRYSILIGDQWAWDSPSDDISGIFQLTVASGANICLNGGHIMQLKGIKELCLGGSLDMKSVLYGSHGEGFPQLKHLEVVENSNLLCVVDTVDRATAPTTAFPVLESLFLRDLRNLEKICRGPLAAESFCQLRDMRVNGCDKLKNVFPLVIGRGLQQLQFIEVTECQNLDVIFAAERGDESSNSNTQVIELTQLTILELCYLPQLTSFCTGDLHFEFPSLEKLRILECPQVKFKSSIHESTKKVFPNLEYLSVDEKHIGLFPEDLPCKLKFLDVWLDGSTAILSLDDFLQRFHSIKFLCIEGNGEYVWEELFETVKNGMNARIKGINEHPDLRQILKQESYHTNNLEVLEISECYNLINLVPSSTSFQNLETLAVDCCDGMINILTSSTAKSLVRLKQMEISHCKLITEIVVDDDDGGDNYAANYEIVFSELKELLLLNLESLTSFCSVNNCAFKFPSLERLVVEDCPNMSIFSGGELSTPNLRKVQLKRFDEREEREKEKETFGKVNEKEKDAKDTSKLESIQFGRESKLMKTIQANLLCGILNKASNSFYVLRVRWRWHHLDPPPTLGED
ncbi:hypothetical protein WN943_007546 [Citrus x changshan-huyou]